MSFRCGFCKQVQPDGTKQELIKTKIRRGVGYAKMINDTSADYVVPWQIAEEKPACPKCALVNRIPEVVGVL